MYCKALIGQTLLGLTAASKTSCTRGHPYTTYVHTEGEGGTQEIPQICGKRVEHNKLSVIGGLAVHRQVKLPGCIGAENFRAEHRAWQGIPCVIAQQ